MDLDAVLVVASGNINVSLVSSDQQDKGPPLYGKELPLVGPFQCKYH